MTQSSPSLPPLKFKPALKDKVWGGHRLEAMVGAPQTNRNIGEAWLIWEGLVVEEGPLQGKSIAQLTREMPNELLGTQSAGQTHFPLLIKFLDPNDWLSVQNHPDDAYAAQHEGVPFGKCEVWWVLDAAPNTSIIHGLKRTVSEAELKAAMTNGQFRDLVEYVPAQVGDIFMNTHGIVHALGTGVMIYELQQSSDITYRLYDWDRQPAPGEPVRELHIDKGAAVADRDPISQHKVHPVVLSETWGTRRVFVACRYFAGEALHVQQPAWLDTQGRSFHILTLLDGTATVQTATYHSQLNKGESVLLPANTGTYSIVPTGGGIEAILAYVPNLHTDIIEPLRQRKIADAAIVQLGGDPARSDLRDLV